MQKDNLKWQKLVFSHVMHLIDPFLNVAQIYILSCNAIISFSKVAKFCIFKDQKLTNNIQRF